MCRVGCKAVFNRAPPGWISWRARILLIDDDESVRRPTARLLELMGHEVLTAEDGEAGLKVWRERGADLVITDVLMPGMNGLEVIVELRAFAPDLALLAVSGGLESQGLDLLGTAAHAGAIRVLSKPFTVQELRSAAGELPQPKRRVRQGRRASSRFPAIEFCNRGTIVISREAVPRRRQRCRAWAEAASLAVLALGTSVLAGWWFKRSHLASTGADDAGHEVLEAQDGAEGLRVWADRGAVSPISTCRRRMGWT